MIDMPYQYIFSNLNSFSITSASLHKNIRLQSLKEREKEREKYL